MNHCVGMLHVPREGLCHRWVGDVVWKGGGLRVPTRETFGHRPDVAGARHGTAGNLTHDTIEEVIA